MNLVAWKARARAASEPRWFPAALLAASCIPALIGLGAMGSDIIAGTRWFGSNPIKEGEHFLGDWTLRFLVATLSVSPLRQISGWNWLGRHRRTLGLFAFGYLMLHWLTYALLDVQLDWGDLVKDLAKRPYIMIGMTAMLLTVPLALTSTKRMIRRLGGKRWNRLHRVVYLACVLGTTHYWMSVKKDFTDPLIYALVFAGLLAYRAWRWTAPSAPDAARA